MTPNLLFLHRFAMTSVSLVSRRAFSVTRDIKLCHNFTDDQIRHKDQRAVSLMIEDEHFSSPSWRFLWAHMGQHARLPPHHVYFGSMQQPCRVLAVALLRHSTTAHYATLVNMMSRYCCHCCTYIYTHDNTVTRKKTRVCFLCCYQDICIIKKLKTIRKESYGCHVLKVKKTCVEGQDNLCFLHCYEAIYDKRLTMTPKKAKRIGAFANYYQDICIKKLIWLEKGHMDVMCWRWREHVFSVTTIKTIMIQIW